LSDLSIGALWRSIIGATGSFDAKKSSLQAAILVVSCYTKSSKDFLKNSDFPA
jgi:hypothetical protein